MAMLAKNTKFFKDKKKTMKCSYCDGLGHTLDRCFQLIGYPPGWKGPRGVVKQVNGGSLKICLSSF